MAIEEVDYTSSDSFSNYTRGDLDSVFGGSTDLWGASEITAEQLNDPAFKIKFDANVGAGRLRADAVSVKVFYSAPFAQTSGAPVYDIHAVASPYTEGDIIWAISDNGVAHTYVATGTGNSGATAPTFPSESGGTVVDEDITWTETGEYIPQSFPPYYTSQLQAGTIGRDSTGQTLFMVVGAKGLIKTSVNGNDWVAQTSGVAGTLRGVAAGESGFVAVGDNGTVVTSADGITWAQEVSGTTESLLGVNFDKKNGTFSACGRNGALRKRAGVAWTRAQN